jgi:nucleoid-associated protein YgaU
MAKSDNSNIINTALSVLSVLLIVLGLFFILTGVKDVFFTNKDQGAITDNQDDPGRINVGISTTKVPTTTPTGTPQSSGSQNVGNVKSAEAKAERTAEVIRKSGKWSATDYVSGDITKGKYTVKQGDTLWEIAEAVYGSGFEWKRILNSNQSQIGRLPNGSQALIVPGQILVIE